jgi:DNA-binding response OmpR family regulator
VIDSLRRTVIAGGVPVELRPREFTLLACLASDPGRVFTKRELVATCWEAPLPPASRALDTQIARIRSRLGSHGRLLVTVWGVGYRLGEDR